MAGPGETSAPAGLDTHKMAAMNAGAAAHAAAVSSRFDHLIIRMENVFSGAQMSSMSVTTGVDPTKLTFLPLSGKIMTGTSLKGSKPVKLGGEMAISPPSTFAGSGGGAIGGGNAGANGSGISPTSLPSMGSGHSIP